MEVLWKLCLQAMNQKRGIVEISPTATIQELSSLAAGKFHVDNPDESSTITLKIASIPARELIDPQQSLEAAGITNQDRIIVEWRCHDKTDENISKAPITDAQPPHPVRRSKRAAAQQATATMPAIIAAQDAATAAATQKKSAMAKSTSINRKVSVAKRKASRSVQKHFATLESPARRLKDGRSIAASPLKKKTKTNSKTETTNESLEEGLIHARKGWREAVNSAYEQNRAVARLAAKHVQYQMVHPQQQETTTTTTQLMVTFEKGIQGRGVFTDTVDFIPRDALQAAIASSEAMEEGLRPSNLALLSPRVFWAVRYHFPADTVEASLQLIAPNRDWSFLRRRKQQLSEKARENLRQQQDDNTTSHWEVAAAAIAAVEDAMANSYNATSVSLSQQPRRLSSVVREEWTIITPTEQDEDELAECVTNGSVAAYAAVDEETQRIVQQLLRQNIHNWRELANCDATDMSKSLHEYSVDLVSQWIDYAQEQTLDEIMVEICDGNIDAVEALRDTAHSGTPRDLALWTPIVSSLHEIVPQYNVSQLERWCFRAQASLDQLSWLSELVTPIVD